eukprot:scaffold962_cov372-Prasinococcus_capsulatus_cf.AAC.6
MSNIPVLSRARLLRQPCGKICKHDLPHPVRAPNIGKIRNVHTSSPASFFVTTWQPDQWLKKVSSSYRSGLVTLPLLKLLGRTATKLLSCADTPSNPTHPPRWNLEYLSEVEVAHETLVHRQFSQQELSLLKEHGKSVSARGSSSTALRLRTSWQSGGNWFAVKASKNRASASGLHTSRSSSDDSRMAPLPWLNLSYPSLPISSCRWHRVSEKPFIDPYFMRSGTDMPGTAVSCLRIASSAAFRCEAIRGSGVVARAMYFSVASDPYLLLASSRPWTNLSTGTSPCASLAATVACPPSNK